jgi:hypothetical protein
MFKQLDELETTQAKANEGLIKRLGDLEAKRSIQTKINESLAKRVGAGVGMPQTSHPQLPSLQQTPKPPQQAKQAAKNQPKTETKMAASDSTPRKRKGVDEPETDSDTPLSAKERSIMVKTAFKRTKCSALDHYLNVDFIGFIRQLDARSDADLEKLRALVVSVHTREFSLFKHNESLFYLKIGGYSGDEGGMDAPALPFLPFARKQCYPYKLRRASESLDEQQRMDKLGVVQLVAERMPADDYRTQHIFPRYCTWL